MMPIGVPTKVASITIRNEPQMALSRPPASLGGGVISAQGGPGQAADAQAHGLPQDPDQPEHAERHGRQRQRQRDLVDALARRVLALARLRRVGRAEQAVRRWFMLRVPSLRRSRASSSLDSDSTTKVMKNSTRPR